MAMMAAADISTTGTMSRSSEEIARVLAMLLSRRLPVCCDLAGGEILFESRLLYVDPARAFVLMESSPDELAVAALLARPRASFRCAPGRSYIEFPVAGARRAEHEGRPAIRLRFPEIMITQQRRLSERIDVRPNEPLKFVADAGGPLSFHGALVDISSAGFGFLQYSPRITLEPGTVLKGCCIELPGRPSVSVDLEVRYSRMEALPQGGNAIRSGCCFLNTRPEVRQLLESFFAH